MKSLQLGWANLQQGVSNAQSSLKLDLYPKDVLANTPKGKVIQLPCDATPVDFAYAVHTELGDECTGAKAHGRIVPLKYKIQNGDVIEIIRTPGHKPTPDWLKIAVTTRARRKIRRWIAEQRRAVLIEDGRKFFEKEASKFHLKAKHILEGPQIEKYLNDSGYAKSEDMLAAIGAGKLMARAVLDRLAQAETPSEIEQARSSKFQKATGVVKRALPLGDDRILVKGSDNLLVNRAPCCNPTRDDEIIGYVTRSKGVSVHSTKCKNIASLIGDPERIIEVAWVVK
jgi:GTP pyrophosphokinase